MAPRHTSKNPNATTSGATAAASAAPSPLVHVAFNHEATHFVAATASGFRVFSCSPLRKLYDVGFPTSGGASIAAAELLSDSYVAVVVAADGDAASTVCFWSELERRFVEGKISLPAAARGARLLGDHVAVAGVDETSVFELFAGARRPVRRVETAPNDLGLCAVAKGGGGGEPLVLACLGEGKGEARVVQCGLRRRPHAVVAAHGSRVAALALSRDGRLLATAGARGTLVRVFSAADGEKLQELRRGTDRADVHCIAFSPDSKWLAVSSNRATVHVFRLRVGSSSGAASDRGNDPLANAAPSPTPASNQRSALSLIKGVLPRYFSSEWSLAQFQLRENPKCAVAFGHEQHTLIITGMDGSFYRCQFDPVQGGEMKQLEYQNFMHLASGSNSNRSRR